MCDAHTCIHARLYARTLARVYINGYARVVAKCRRVFRCARTNRCVNLLTFYPHVSALSSPFWPTPTILFRSSRLSRPGNSTRSIKYILSAESREMTSRDFGKFFQLTSLSRLSLRVYNIP